MDKKGLVLLLAVSILFIMGLLMVFNITAAEILDQSLNKNIHYALIKQIAYAFLGVLCAGGVWWIGYHSLLKISGYLLAFFTFLLFLVFIPGIGLQMNGAHRWLGLFGNSLQPSEFVKYIIPLCYIRKITDDKSSFMWKSFLKLMVFFTVPIGLILLEPDNGTVVIILSSLIALFLISRLKWIYWILPLGLLIIGGGVVAFQMKYVSDRIRIYMNPELDLQGKGHQPHQAKIAAGSGQWIGKGFGESLQKMSYLPEARSDYIAAIFAEEFGFIGIIGLITLYIIIGSIGYSIALSCKEAQGFYLVSIYVFLISFQAFLNLGVVSGILPSKGTNLPFFSQGGSSLLANLIALSVILQVHTQSKKVYV